ncbi:MAG: vWA domain-containing protein [Pseudomonadota bacterium]
MRLVIALNILGLAGTLFCSGTVEAKLCGKVPEALIVMDRSGSMEDFAGTQSKWDIAVDATNYVCSSFPGQLRFGLTFFPLWPHNQLCSPGEVNVAPGTNTAGAISSLLSTVYPLGNTPIKNTLDNARTYLQQIKEVDRDQYVILVTDGIENCTMYMPSAATANLFADGVKTYVIGFGSEINSFNLTKAAQAGGTNDYFQADNLTQLKSALQTIAAELICCGNGILDQGESCDITIPTGMPGACPTTCNDNDPCTVDALAGTECLTQCSNSQISAPFHGDGCCPTGANSGNDSDCPKACGDGVLDPGEKCDPGILSGYGTCPTQCDDGDSCTNDTTSGGGCQVTCTSTSVPPHPTSDGCCPPGMSSIHDPDCPPPCDPDRTENCVDPCASVVCGDEEHCENGLCVKTSSGDDPNGNPTNPYANPDSSGKVQAGCECNASHKNGGFPIGIGMLFLLLVGKRIFSKQRCHR